MKRGNDTILVCNCERTMQIDGEMLARTLGAEGTGIHRQLCRAELDMFEQAAAAGGRVCVACTQEAPLFAEVAEELETSAELAFFNIREAAGWGEDGAKAGPKIAALIAMAQAAAGAEPAGTMTLESEGQILVYGAGQAALDAAERLSASMAVSLILTDAEGLVPPVRSRIAIFKGKVTGLRGHLGAFTADVRNLAPMRVSSREALAFDEGPGQTALDFDVVLDMTGGAPLVSGHERRDGYLRADPRDPGAVARALFDASALTGSFEKPLYVRYQGDLCAHSRSGKTGCTRCLDVCPAAAISPAGDTVAIDPAICGGCGACNSVCPTGAATYAVPRPADLIDQVRILLETYAKAGGRTPHLLFHDGRHGAEMVAMIARFGRGLPAHVLPVEVNEVTQIGLDVLASALSYGAAGITLLPDPKHADETAGLSLQAEIAEAVRGAMGLEAPVRMLIETDPEAVEAALWSATGKGVATPAKHLPRGDRRGLQRLALRHLRTHAPETPDMVALPEGAPFGTIEVDVEGCTLCLSCVGACPTAAIADNPDRPQLRFTEELCIQCGLCQATCPEKVISLTPRLSFLEEAAEPRILKEEEPFACVRCGKDFGVKSSVERIVSLLAGKHPMFQDEARIRIMQMCDDCRVIAQMETAVDPYAAGPRPRVRTTEDDLRERDEAAKKGGGET